MAEMVNPDREVTVRPSYFSLNINKWRFSWNNKASKIDKLSTERTELLDWFCNSSNIKQMRNTQSKGCYAEHITDTKMVWECFISKKNNKR